MILGTVAVFKSCQINMCMLQNISMGKEERRRTEEGNGVILRSAPEIPRSSLEKLRQLEKELQVEELRGQDGKALRGLSSLKRRTRCRRKG